MEIQDEEGYTGSLETRLTSMLDTHPPGLGALLALLVEKAGLTQADLIDCGILDSDETVIVEK